MLRLFLHMIRAFTRRNHAAEAGVIGQHPCRQCGQPTTYTHLCDSCAQAVWRGIGRETTPGTPAHATPGAALARFTEQPTQPVIPAAAPVNQQVNPPANSVDFLVAPVVDLDALAGVPPAAEADDDLPFPDGYPDLPATPMALLAFLLPARSGSRSTARKQDEFSEDVVRLRLARESLPPLREDWSSRCPWCAREMRELSDDGVTHPPRRETLQTCPRHHAARLALLADLHSGGWRTRFGGEASEGGDASQPA